LAILEDPEEPRGTPQIGFKEKVRLEAEPERDTFHDGFPGDLLLLGLGQVEEGARLRRRGRDAATARC
jgi:hypothetical protein